MKSILLFICIFISALSVAQTPTITGLQFYYPFEECPLSQMLSDKIGNSVGIFKGGVSPECICGVQDTAIRLDGGNDYVRFEGSSIDQALGVVDFTFSFYIRPIPAIGLQEVFSKRNLCDEDNFFSITYNSNRSELNVHLRENENNENMLSAQINPNACWTHVAIARDGALVQLYIDGELAIERESSRRVDFTNGGPLMIAAPAFNPCPDILPFRGWLDELALFRGALSPNDMRSLYRFNERILNRDTIIILGQSVPISTNISCSDEFTWTPKADLDDPNERDAFITPTESQTYQLRFVRAGFCNVTDTIRITVIDPSDFDCDQVFLPSAFTPNGDGLNETYGISNDFVFFDNLESFEIFDRWGSRVFFSNSPQGRWDGTFNGEPVNPGIYHYRLLYECQEKMVEKWGSVTVMR